MTDFRVLDAEAYYQTLLREVPKAKKRIVLAAMIVVWGERTAPLFIMLQDAVKRGVQVTVLLDNYTRLPYFYGLQPRSTRTERVKQTMQTLEDLSRAGAKVYCWGKIGFPPYKGRCHVKATVIDDTSYSFGGVNLIEQSFKNADYMLYSKNAEVADCLSQLVTRIGKTRPPLPDGEVTINKDTNILFDGGRPKQSLIYDRARELTTQANRVYVVTAMAPSGPLAALLREVDAHIYTNRPEAMMPIDGIGQAFDLERYRLTNSYQGQAYLHTKYMLFELASGRKAVLSGSHNFSYRGVAFGTQEVALQSYNPELWDALRHFITSKLAKR